MRLAVNRRAVAVALPSLLPTAGVLAVAGSPESATNRPGGCLSCITPALVLPLKNIPFL